MGSAQSQEVELGPIIDLTGVCNENGDSIHQLEQSLSTRSYATFSLTDESKIQSLHHLIRNANTFFGEEQEEKNKLISDEGNVGYVKTSTREFLKLRNLDIDRLKENESSDIDTDNASLSLQILEDIGWKCFKGLNRTSENIISDEELIDLKECLEERASLSIVHYFPARKSESDDYIREMPKAKDICGHTESSFETCSQHKDTGIFTLILTSNVPGLEVYDTLLKCWIPLEKLIQNHRDSPKKEIMVLMMGHKAPLFLGNQYEPTLHRVSVEKDVERPSFLYFMDTAKIN